MNVLDLFSGIGGFSLGLERAGMRTVAFCEIDSYCRKVLAKHWPNVPCYDDVRTLTADRLHADGIRVDAICGGFPCQDISVAGKGAGLEGERSGLWSQYARIIGELRPIVVVVENVTALLGRGLDRVLGDLAALGYDAEWHCIPASAIGAPHRRDRIWIVAYANRRRRRSDVAGGHYAHRNHAVGAQADGLPGALRQTGGEPHLADADSGDAQRLAPQGDDTEDWRKPLIGPARLRDGAGHHRQWSPEPDVGRVAHGIPNRVDRLKGLGNAVVPQIPEIIGRAIMRTSMVTSHQSNTPGE